MLKWLYKKIHRHDFGFPLSPNYTCMTTRCYGLFCKARQTSHALVCDEQTIINPRYFGGCEHMTPGAVTIEEGE